MPMVTDTLYGLSKNLDDGSAAMIFNISYTTSFRWKGEIKTPRKLFCGAHEV